MTIGDTGIVTLGDKNPATNDCFWQAQLLKIDNAKKEVYVCLEDSRQGWVRKCDFTPMYMRGVK